MASWAEETAKAAASQNLIRRQVRQCTCEIYSRDDADCELHHPDVIEDEDARHQALVYWWVGYEAGMARAADVAVEEIEAYTRRRSEG